MFPPDDGALPIIRPYIVGAFEGFAGDISLGAGGIGIKEPTAIGILFSTTLNINRF